MITPSAISPTCGGLLRRPDAEADRDRHGRRRRAPASTTSPSSGGSSRALAGHARSPTRRRRSPRAGLPIRSTVVRRRGRRDQRHERDPGLVARGAQLRRLVGRHVGHDQARRRRARRARPATASKPARAERVRVAHQHHRRRARASGAATSSSTRSKVAPASQRPLARGLDRRAVRERIGEGNAELDQVGARVRVGLARRAASRARSGKPPIR